MAESPSAQGDGAGALRLAARRDGHAAARQKAKSTKISTPLTKRPRTSTAQSSERRGGVGNKSLQLRDAVVTNSTMPKALSAILRQDSGPLVVLGCSPSFPESQNKHCVPSPVVRGRGAGRDKTQKQKQRGGGDRGENTHRAQPATTGHTTKCWIESL